MKKKKETETRETAAKSLKRPFSSTAEDDDDDDAADSEVEWERWSSCME